MKRLYIILFAGLIFQFKIYKIGSLSELVSEEFNADPTFSKYFDRYYTKTYDAFIYQYPVDVVQTQINLPSFSIPTEYFKEYSYKKEVNANPAGLHREINYLFNFTIEQSKIDAKKLKDGQCKLAIIDYCDSYFYIEYEDILQTDYFRYQENKRMDIEKIASESPQYTFFMEFLINDHNKKLNLKEKGALLKIEISQKLNFHLRYGQPNRVGKILYKLSQGYSVASNCFTEKLDEKTRSKLMLIPRYEWALKALFGDEPFAFYMIDANKTAQNFILPVANTEQTYWVIISTKLLAWYGAIVIIFALFFGSKKSKFQN